MNDQAKRFEITILRPLQVVLIISVIVMLFKGMWWWMFGCVVSIFYLGIIGSKLHPIQSASDLAKGPTEGPAAQIETVALPDAVKRMLIGHACTKVGILLGVVAGLVSWTVLGWRWYFAILIFWFIMMLSGSILKLVFKAI